MYFFFYSIIVFVVSLLCLYHWRNQPLYADDGNWFYDAEFDCEINPYRLDYFGIGFIAKYFRKIYFVKSEKAYYDLKIIWFSLLNSVLFILCYLIFEDFLIASLSVLFHLIFQVLPQTRYSLTYGENFLLLPLLIGFLVFRFAYFGNSLLLYLLAGLFFGWAYQIKIVTIIAVVPLVILSFFYISFIELFVIIFGFLLINFLQIFKAQGFKNILFLTKCLFKWHLYFYIFSSKLIKFNVFKKFYSLDKKKDNSYVAQRAKVSYRDILNEFNKSIFPTIQNTFSICILSLSMLVYNIINYDFCVTIVSVFFVGCFVIPIAEKSFFPAHFNQVWLPVSVLASLGFKSIIDSNNLFFFVFSLILFLCNLHFIINQISKRLSNQMILADYPAKYNLKFHYSKEIGAYIQKKSDKNDFLFVWGNCPSIYIYSKRRIIDKSFFHLYLHNKLAVKHNIDRLLVKMKKYPPKWFLFYKIGIYDEWTIEVIKELTQIPYKFHKVFNLNLNNTTFFKETLYEVDILRFREILFDRFITHYYDSEDCKDLHDGLSSYLSKSEIDILIKSNNQYNLENDNLINILVSVLSFLKKNQTEKAKTLLHNNKKNQMPAIFDLLLGEIYFFENNLESAYNCFLSSIELNPYLCSSWNNLGVLYQYNNEIDKAKNCFLKAITFNENYHEAKENLNMINNLKR